MNAGKGLQEDVVNVRVTVITTASALLAFAYRFCMKWIFASEKTIYNNNSNDHNELKWKEKK